MNDLVKEVFVAIRANTAATVTEAETAARAAIAAVTEWLDNSHKLDDDSKVSLALRAAVGENK